MCQESENQFLIKLKIILNSNYFYLGLLVFTVIFLLISNSISRKSIYDLEQKEFDLVIESYVFEDNKISFNFKGKEDLVGSYYLNNKSNIDYLKSVIDYGNEVIVYGKLKEPSNNTIPNTFNYKKYLENKGIFYTINVTNIKLKKENTNVLYSLKSFIRKRIDVIDGKGYMRAFILGDKSLLDDDMYECYQSIGIAHLFALSGMHIGLLSSILLFLFKDYNKYKKYIIVDSILLIYGYIVSFPESIKRCIIFFILNSINKIFGLELKNWKVFLLTVFLLIIINYKCIYDTGFLFSVFTVGGIIACENFIKNGGKLQQSFRLAIVAFLFSMPISLYSYYEINILSIIFNLFYIPFVSLVIYPLSLISFLFSPLYSIFNWFTNVLEQFSLFLSNISFLRIFLSFNIVEVIIAYIMLFLGFLRHKKIYFVFLFVLFIIDYIVPYFDSNGYVYFFDVGQGDSCLIISPYRKDVVLLDTGGSDQDLYRVSDNYISFMKYLGIGRINNIILSHGDKDHAGELSNVIKNFYVGNVNVNYDEHSEYEEYAVSKIHNGNYLYKNVSIKFLNFKKYDNENDNSLLTLIQLKGFKILSLGDASSIVENELVKKYDLDSIDILKVSHHGSKTSTSDYFIKEIDPTYAVISVGKNNKYGHPNKNVLENLKDVNVYRTDIDGSVVFKFKNNGIELKTYSP